MPTCRIDFSLGSQLTVFIDYLGFDYIKYLFGIYITASLTLPALAIHLVCYLLEVCYRTYRITVIDREATRIHDEHLIEHFVDVR